MPSSGSAFALASHLRVRGDTELIDLIRNRQVKETGVNDFFDLAERLLDRTSIQLQLNKLDRRVLLTLAVICELTAPGTPIPLSQVEKRIREIDHPESLAFPSTLEARVTRLAAFALVSFDDSGVYAYDTVCEQIESWPSIKLPSVQQLSSDLPPSLGDPGRIDQDATDSLAAERAFGTSVALIELVAALEHENARELARGGLGTPDTKRLALAAGVPPEHVPALLTIGLRAEILDLSGGLWAPTPSAAEWAVEPLAARWARLADGWLGVLPDDIRFILADRAHAVWGEKFIPFLRWLYPASDESFRAMIDAAILRAELLGITAGYAPSTAGSALLRRGKDAAEAAMSSLLPPEIDQVYVQHDLSVVSPGPLAPRVDARLREMSTVESRALASTFRISAESITRALASGDTEESILEFLSSISLTGLPQPLRYLVNETAVRYGLLRVGTVIEGASAANVSYVRSEDDQLLATLLVDRRLAPLGLHREGEGRAVSRFDRDIVFLAILDAKYPAAAENSAGETVTVDHRSRSRHASATSAKTSKDPARTIVERLRHSGIATESESSTAWLERQLEVAIRSKLSVTVSVTMPDGSLQDYLLEPTGLSAGRLRARDRKADIERTLPLSRIAVVEQHDPS